jgi:hypothetical protein
MDNQETIKITVQFRDEVVEIERRLDLKGSEVNPVHSPLHP